MPAHDFTKVSPNIFHDLHGGWIYVIKNALNNGILPEGYLALSEQSQGDVVPDSGHWIMEENPTATIKLVRAFLDAKPAN